MSRHGSLQTRARSPCRGRRTPGSTGQRKCCPWGFAVFVPTRVGGPRFFLSLTFPSSPFFSRQQPRRRRARAFVKTRLPFIAATASRDLYCWATTSAARPVITVPVSQPTTRRPARRRLQACPAAAPRPELPPPMRPRGTGSGWRRSGGPRPCRRGRRAWPSPPRAAAAAPRPQTCRAAPPSATPSTTGWP